MPIKKRRPVTPGQRQMSIADFSVLTKKRPEKRLARGKKRLSGRDSAGHITVRHRGGGHKRLYRKIDFGCFDKDGVAGTIAAIEYDPNRSAYLALVRYMDGDKRYMLAPEHVKVGDQVVSGKRTKVKAGNRMELQYIPTGYRVFNIALHPQGKGCIVRSAGTAAKLMALDGDHAILQLPSGEVRKVHKACRASIGAVGNPEHNLITIGKAGRMRWLGRRPQVLGKSMNAVDHPHGGGEGHSPVGLKKGPKTPWGKKALGVKTRRKKHLSNQFILRRRTKKKRKK